MHEEASITSKNAKGRRIVRLAPGLVSFRIYDASNMHNFHLRGPWFNRATDIRGTGHVVWRVRLTAGKWKFRCDEHPLGMHGAFVVGTPATRGRPAASEPSPSLVERPRSVPRAAGGSP